MFSRNISVNASVVASFDDLIAYHIVNACLGSACLMINILLLFIFLSYPPFRRKYVLLILLCIGDSINSLATVLTGLNRIYLYSTAMRTLTLPVRNSLECASELWLIIKLIGDLLIPVCTFWMGVERFTAIMFPIFYRLSVDGKAVKFVFIPGISCIFVAVSMVIAFSIAANSDRPVHFYCGRKAAFGENFGTFIYLCNIVCNLASSILNGAAYLRARQLCKIQCRIQRQVAIIRYYLLISLLSTLLVSLPNAIALFQLYVQRVGDSVSKPASW
ncbi:hypothetical protein WR25_27068 [Diploscapter pachys]|uniref:G-protein coupled receptors family 1 profile domain-containing protein n=1 Tax=Diploscapter pachys TaxID=2018661 RepID=A0A2A2KCM9_9BILA|nr:hypothetical protein WR25_27068 [Diploscapter pachys]